MPTTTTGACRCGAIWTGARACHCSGCHHTFSGVRLFDLHRSARGERGACTDPTTIRTSTDEPAMQLRAGVWRGPAMDSETRQRIGTSKAA